MAYDYEKAKKAYQSMTKEQQQQYADQNKNDANFQRFALEYAQDTNRNNTVATPTTTTKTSPYQNQWAGNYTYNPTSQMYEKSTWWYQNQWEWNYVYNPVTQYYENTSKPQTNQYTDYSNYSTLNQQQQDFAKQMQDTQNQYGTNVNNQYNSIANQINKINETSQKGYSDLMWGTNYAKTWDEAIENKLQSAFWMSTEEFKQRYPEQYEYTMQALENLWPIFDATDPNSRQLLDWWLQGIIWAGVWAWSDTSKLNVLNQSLMDKFEDWEKVSEDMRNIVKLQTEWLTTAEIAKKMGISEDQVQQAIFAYNGLDNKLWEYYKLKEWVAKDITEPYDTQLARLDEEKKIALERANRQVDRLTEDFNTTLERQKQQNDINAHNADAIAGRTGLWFSKRWIEGLNYVAEQARQIIDDITKNYDRNNQNLADGIADIIRNWQYNNEDLMKASEDALTKAKNNFTSNMLAVQQQYGTVGLQAQQALANNVQWFIEQAEAIYDNALTRQQQNLTNLINNVSNINALEAQNLTMRNAKIQQFQAESMNLNRNQLQQLAQQLGMDTTSYQDLVNYQAQAVANELNWYLPWAWVQFQWQIQSYLDSWYTPQQAMSAIMNSQEFKAATTQSGTWSSAWGGVIFNNATWESKYIWVDGMWYTTWTSWYWDYDYSSMWNYGSTTNFVSSETVNWKEYWTSENTLYGLQDFMNTHKVGDTWGQCGAFVNDYLESLGLGRVFTDPIDKKTAAINTEEWYTPQVWDIVVMDGNSRKYGHVAIVTNVAKDWTITTLESNKHGEWEIFSRTFNPEKTKRVPWQRVFGYYHPDGNTTNVSNNTWGSIWSDNWPLTDYGVPIPYDRSIKAMIPTQLMNSEIELKKLESNIESLYKAGYSAEDAVLQYMWFNINNPENKDIAINLVNAVRSLTNDDNVQSAVSYISQKINAGDYNAAITKVENLVRAEAKKQEWDGYFDESTARWLVEKANALIELANSMPEDIGLFEWTMQKYLKKLKSSDASKLNTAISYLTDEQKLKLVWSNVTDHELEMVKNWIPQLDDRTETFMNKINQLKQNALTNLNARRQTYWLPALDESALMNSTNKKNLYMWWIQNNTWNGISPIDTVQNQLTTYNTQTQGRIWSGIKAWWTMQSGKRL